MTDKMLAVLLFIIIALCVVFTYFHPLAHKIHKETPTPLVVTVPEKTEAERFQFAVRVVLEHEGGLTDDKADPGGISKYGISLKFIRSEHLCIDSDCKDDANEIINLTQKQADSIYFEYFWSKFHFNQIENEIIATKAFDMAVNSGPSESILLLKKALNKVISEPVSLDYTLDEETVDIINNVDCDRLHRAMIAVEKDFYSKIIKEHPQFVIFRDGWMARAAW